MRETGYPETSYWERMQPPAAPERGAAATAFRPQTRGGGARIYLVAVEREAFPPLAFGNTILQRMRVTLAPPDRDLEAAGASPVAFYSAGTPARCIKGEILRDDKGRFYEKIGNFVRELGTLEASPEGDLVEVGRHAANAPAPAPSRKLFSDPGQWRVLRWGEFKGILAGQISHPERLRDDHRLPCYVQVVEARSRALVTDLAQSVLGDAALARELFHLSPEIAERFELASLLPQAHTQPVIPRERGVVLPGDRLFLLRVASDPTAEAAPAASAAPERKRQIPEPFASQALLHTREEALLEMRMHAGLPARFGKWIRSLFSGGEFDRWQRTLWGRNPDDQLWAVAPPGGMPGDPAVREWAAATLEAAGYDVAEMLREWEIYWRRKRP